MAAPDPIDHVLAALANPARRQIVVLLARHGGQPVHTLAAHFDMARPSVSEHLKVLRDAGLVSEERNGRERLYSLEVEPLRDLRGWIDTYEGFWRDKMAALRAVLDETE